jgi:hypothetical protein
MTSGELLRVLGALPPTLRQLGLEGCLKLSGIATLASSLARLCHLSQLVLSTDEAYQLAVFTAPLPTLPPCWAAVPVRGKATPPSRAGSEEPQALLEVRQCPMPQSGLVALGLHECVDDAALPLLARQLPLLQNLRELDLSANVLGLRTDGHIRSLFAAVAQLPCLESLLLKRNEFKGATVDILCAFLPQCPRLASLDLTGNLLDEPCAMRLVAALHGYLPLVDFRMNSQSRDLGHFHKSLHAARACILAMIMASRRRKSVRLPTEVGVSFIRKKRKEKKGKKMKVKKKYGKGKRGEEVHGILG